MRALLDAFWRAAAYCLHPRVIMLTLLPLLLMAGLALGLGYFYWAAALQAVRATFDSWTFLSTLVGWLDRIGLGGVDSVLAPLAVVLLSTPLIVVLSLLLVAAMLTPSVLKLVAERRFALLARKRGGSFVGSLFGALWATLAALAALLLSVPLWFVPPLVLVLPPLIWGWLTYRVMTYDVLAEHASVDERRELVRRHRSSLFGIGIITGYLGAAPSLVFASGALTVVLAPVLVPLAVWIYMLVFAFSALWFAHFALAALQALRVESGGLELVPQVAPADRSPSPPSPPSLINPTSPVIGTIGAGAPAPPPPAPRTPTSGSA